MEDEVKDIDYYYGLLEAADKKAEAGDKEAAKDAQEIYNHIQTLKGPQRSEKESETPPIIGAVIGGNLGAGVSGVGGTVGAAKLGYDLWKDYQKSKGLGAVQNWANQMIGNPNTNVPLKELEKLTGLPARTYSEVDKIAKVIEGSPAVPAQRVPVTKLVNGVPTVVSYKQIPGVPEKPPIDISMYENLAPTSTVGKFLTSKPAQATMKALGAAGKYGVAPILGGASAGYQGIDAINAAKKGDVPGAVISGLGSAASLGSMYGPWSPVLGPIAGALETLKEFKDATPEEKLKMLARFSAAGYKQGGLIHLNK